MKNTATLLAKYPSVPRYTSYPTAPHFYALPGGARKSWLASLPDETVSLYIHLPYCAKQCWYCGCNTRISRRYEPVTKYLDFLAQEIRDVAAAIGRRQRVGHIHFGGGSPSMLHPGDFLRLMHQLADAFAIEPASEIAIELDPRTVSEAKMAAYAVGGVNRISVGVQDFDDAVQKAINRQQPFHTVYETVRLAREYGITQHSFDLVYGLPKQTLDGFARTLDQVLLLRPGRLALFGYAHVPWMKKAMRLIDETTLPDAALRCSMAAHAAKRLEEAGYVTVGLDHYALPDDALATASTHGNLKRNFQGYGTDANAYLIGLGASSISYLPQGYVQNPPLIENYTKMLQQEKLPQEKGFALTPQDRLHKTVIETLMCEFSISLDAVCRSAGFPADSLDRHLAALQPLVDDGFVAVNGRNVQVLPGQPQAVRLACTAFDTYFRQQENRHAQVS